MRAFWPRRRWRRSLALLLGGTLLWTLLVCYPNPADFIRNFARYRHLPIDPKIEQKMGWGLPNDPAEIERFVDTALVSASDWRLYGMPWYVPLPAQVATSLRGDCEGKAVLLASLLAGRHVPFEIRASFNHIWVDYAGRRERPGETRQLAYLEGKGGRLHLRWPRATDWKTWAAVEKQMLWDDMPPLRKLTWVAGLLWLALGSIAIGLPRVWGDLLSSWRPSPRTYVDPVLALLLVQLVMLVGFPSLGLYDFARAWPGFVLEWNLAGLLGILLLSWLSLRFLPRRLLAVNLLGEEIVTISARVGLRRLRRLPVRDVHHLQLLSPRGEDAPWTLAAVQRSGRREPLLHYRREVEARRALRALGRQLDLPLVVRSDGAETTTHAAEIGLPLSQRLAEAPLPPPRPKQLDLAEEVGEERWALRYPVTSRGVRWVLLGVALTPAALFGLACLLLGRHPQWRLAWFFWMFATAVLCTTVYVMLLSRTEMVARLSHAGVEIADGRLRSYRPDGAVEEVPLEAVESVELGRLRGAPTIAVVTPTQVLHVRDLCTAEERPWVQAALTAAVIAAQRRQLSPSVASGAAGESIQVTQ